MGQFLSSLCAMERQLKIKSGACSRLLKEVGMYEKEIDEQMAAIERCREQNKDPYEIKQLENALQETKQVLPDTVRRLETALDQLKEFISESKDNVNCGDAEKIVSETEEFLQGRSRC